MVSHSRVTLDCHKTDQPVYAILTDLTKSPWFVRYLSEKCKLSYNTLGNLQVMVTTPKLPDPDRSPQNWVVNDVLNKESFKSKTETHIPAIMIMVFKMDLIMLNNLIVSHQRAHYCPWKWWPLIANPGWEVFFRKMNKSTDLIIILSC